LSEKDRLLGQRSILQRGTSPQKKELELTAEMYEMFSRYLEKTSGILLAGSKQYLVKNRLSTVLNDSEYESLSSLILALQKGAASSRLKMAVTNVMTTNETFWFRDKGHFDLLKDKIFDEQGSSIKVWSAACSSGQEPYSISLSFEEYLRKKSISGRTNMQILATDISEKVIADGRAAIYSNMSLSRGMPEDLKSRYFKQHRDDWVLNSAQKSRVRFQQFNLLQSFDSLGLFDVIFIRNVLIYFPEETKRDILERLAKALNPGGALFLSSTESLPSGFKLLEPVRERAGRYYQLKSS
jgi:chemotaxis protein methyltransferase CheR